MRERGPVGWVRAHPFAADALLAGLLISTFLSMMLLTWHDPVADGLRSPDALRIVLLVVGVVPVAFRRRAPVPALATRRHPSTASSAKSAPPKGTL